MKISNITSKIRGELIIGTYKEFLGYGVKVLDVGCGNGVVSQQIALALNLKLTGCDTLSYLTCPINFAQMTTENKLPFPKDSFDSVMFNDVLHHIYPKDQEKILAEAARVSKQILIFELQPTFLGSVSDWLINKVHNWNMRIPFTYRSVDQWLDLFKKLELNCETKYIIVPWWYPFTHVAFRLSKI